VPYRSWDNFAQHRFLEMPGQLGKNPFHVPRFQNHIIVLCFKEIGHIFGFLSSSKASSKPDAEWRSKPQVNVLI